MLLATGAGLSLRRRGALIRLGQGGVLDLNIDYFLLLLSAAGWDDVLLLFCWSVGVVVIVDMGVGVVLAAEALHPLEVVSALCQDLDGVHELFAVLIFEFVAGEVEVLQVVVLSETAAKNPSAVSTREVAAGDLERDKGLTLCNGCRQFPPRSWVEPLIKDAESCERFRSFNVNLHAGPKVKCSRLLLRKLPRVVVRKIWLVPYFKVELVRTNGLLFDDNLLSTNAIPEVLLPEREEIGLSLRMQLQHLSNLEPELLDGAGTQTVRMDGESLDDAEVCDEVLQYFELVGIDGVDVDEEIIASYKFLSQLLVLCRSTPTRPVAIPMMQELFNQRCDRLSVQMRRRVGLPAIMRVLLHILFSLYSYVK